MSLEEGIGILKTAWVQLGAVSIAIGVMLWFNYALMERYGEYREQDRQQREEMRDAFQLERDRWLQWIEQNDDRTDASIKELFNLWVLSTAASNEESWRRSAQTNALLERLILQEDTQEQPTGPIYKGRAGEILKSKEGE